ncbi:MAG: Ppx/GppA family phosphatase [bacterium]|nr:Ppx/GppA family phosphatase [bacterium]
MAGFGVIDIGTNSIKVHLAVAERDSLRVLDDRTAITRLGQGLHETGLLAEEPQERSVEVIREFMAIGRELGVTGWVGIGTMALRNATNAEDFIARVAAATGLQIEVISGEEEARLANLAAISSLGRQEGVTCIFDSGGGSTEFVFSERGRICDRFSLNTGSRRPTEEFCLTDPVTDGELAALLSSLAEDFGVLRERSADVEILVGVGGTVTTLAAISLELASYDPRRVQGLTLARSEIERQLALFHAHTVAERKTIVGLIPQRADVILAGAALVLTVVSHLDLPHLIVSDRGLRHAVMYDRFLPG